MKASKTYQDLNNLIQIANQIVANQETKTQKKLFKIYEKLKTHHEDFQSQFEELRLDNAAVNADGILLVDDKGQYQFNKEGIKNLTKDIKALNNKLFEFDVIEVVNPAGLEQLGFLEGWVSGVEFTKAEEIVEEEL
jgi:hypothetical protein